MFRGLLKQYSFNVRSRGKQFFFPRVLLFVKGNIRTQGKTKLTGFPRDLTLSVLLYFYAFTSTYFNCNKRICLSGAKQDS